jgi:hypothetical protein
MSAKDTAVVTPINGSKISIECPLCGWLVFRYRGYFSGTGPMVRCPKCLGLYYVQTGAIAEPRSEIQCEAKVNTDGMV